MEEIKLVETAKEIAGKSIGRFGLGYITAIVLIGVGSSYFLSDSAITAVMTMISSALMAIINMMNGIAGTAEKEEKPEIALLKNVIDQLNKTDPPTKVIVEGKNVMISRGEDTITTGGRDVRNA